MCSALNSGPNVKPVFTESLSVFAFIGLFGWEKMLHMVNADRERALFKFCHKYDCHNYYLNFIWELTGVKHSPLVLFLYDKSFVCFALLVTCLEIKIVLDM